VKKSIGFYLNTDFSSENVSLLLFTKLKCGEYGRMIVPHQILVFD
jgi:hypothetical protein